MKGLEVVSLEKGQPWRQRSERAPPPPGWCLLQPMVTQAPSADTGLGWGHPKMTAPARDFYRQT